MAKEHECQCRHNSTCGGGNAVYGLGLVGAAIYFLQHAPTVWLVIVGLFKAFIWPVFVVYELLKFFQL